MDNNIKIGIYDNCFNKYVFSAIPVNSRCLDVGCWTGNLGKKLIEHKGCIVDGIDQSEKALKFAKKSGYRNLYNINLNKENQHQPRFKNLEKYDCIICSDILEHLVNPGTLLQQLKGILKDDGIIIISIPNIAFIQQRILLLLGFFDYNPNGGIMDSTHLRFYTKKSVVTLVKNAGFSVSSIKGYTAVRNRFFILRFMSKILPEIFAMQYLLKVTKSS